MGFDSFLGNAKAVRSVRDMLVRCRVPGSLLFTGPEGVGKKTLAFMLAKALNCERRGPGGDDFCGECAHCRRADEMFAASREDLVRRRDVKDAQRRVEGILYLDIQLIEPLTRFILIEQIRQLRATAYARPFELAQRVILVDDAQAIHWQAADLLLKVLEEPPESTTLILICPNAFELRPTIRSRCLTLQFSPVEDAFIERILAEERQLPEAQWALATRVISGSITRAKTFDPAGFLQQRQPWLDFLEVVAGAQGRPPGPREWKLLFDTTKTLAGTEIETALKTGSLLFRDLAHILAQENSPEVTNVDLKSRLKTWAHRLGMAGIEKLAESVEEAYRLQTRNINQQLSLDSLAAELALHTLAP